MISNIRITKIQLVASANCEISIKKAFPENKKSFCVYYQKVMVYSFLPEASRFLSILCPGRVHFGFSPKA